MITSKSEIRGLVRRREKTLTPAAREISDKILINRFLSLPEYLSSRCVFLYLGVGAELDTAPIIEDALRRGKRAALPKITAPGVMEAREIRSLSELVPGAFHIPEPRETCPVVPPGEFDLILVPGAAFAKNGARLGRGGGYYDRYLPQTRGKKVALAREIQLFDALPTENHDIPIDLLITDEGDAGAAV